MCDAAFEISVLTIYHQLYDPSVWLEAQQLTQLTLRKSSSRAQCLVGQFNERIHQKIVNVLIF